MTMAPSQLGAFTSPIRRRNAANIQYHVQPLSLDSFGEPLHRFPAFTASVANLRPDLPRHASRSSPPIRRRPRRSGPITLHAGGPPRRRRLHPRHPPDRRPAGAERVCAGRIRPGPSVARRRRALVQAAGDIGTTIFHPVGTRRWAAPTIPLAVVDERLRVIGMGLARHRRLGDADITSGNTNSPTMMIAEKGAAMTGGCKALIVKHRANGGAL